MYAQLVHELKPLARRLRWRTSVELLTRTAWLALAAAALALVVARFAPLENYLLIAASIVGVYVGVWLTYSALHRLTPFHVARRVDDELALRDRLATALQFTKPDAHINAGIHPDLIARQIDDAVRHLQGIAPREAFPPRLDRRRSAAALFAALAIVALVFIPNPMDAVIVERREIAKTAQEQAKKLEELAKTLEENKNLNPQDKEQLLRKLRELAAQLKANPGDAKQALADVAKFQDALRASLNLNQPSQAAALDALAQQMAALAKQNDAPDDANELAKLLEQLASDPNALSAEERAALAQALQQTASQVAASDPNLASALSELAQQLSQNASSQALQNAAQQASNALQNAAQQQALQQALAQSLNQADAAQRAVSQAGQTAGRQTSNSQASNGQAPNGQGQGNQGQGQGGQGQGQGTQGQGKIGSGQITGGGGGSPSGTAGDPTQPNKSFNTDDANTVYSQFQVGQGQQENVSGQDSGSGQTTTQQNKSPLPGANNSALVPYSQVFQQYNQIAGQAMENSYIPAGLKDYVKQYFSALEP